MKIPDKFKKSAEALRLAEIIFPEGKLSSADMKKFPLMYEKGEGTRVYDADGNAYIDYFIGNGPLIMGHRHPEVMAAVQDQLSRGTNLGGHTKISLALAKRSATPGKTSTGCASRAPVPKPPSMRFALPGPSPAAITSSASRGPTTVITTWR